MNNSIFNIQPYKYQGLWVFDDERVDLVKEPFVSGMPEIIEYILASKKWTKTSFNMIFSATELPEYDIVLTKEKRFAGGNWYIDTVTGMRGWLCPALYLYFKRAPKKLYFKFN
jgi:hypothetical protein